jgi:hypothetical protein
MFRCTRFWEKVHPYPGFRILLHLARIQNPDPSSAEMMADPNSGPELRNGPGFGSEPDLNIVYES